jgi:hypothetical protein
MDIKKMLDDMNPSKEVMKWIIVGLVALLTGTFAYQKFFGEKPVNAATYDAKISVLAKELFIMNTKYMNLSKRVQAEDISHAQAIADIQTYFEKRIKFVAENSKKDTKYLMDVLSMSEYKVQEKQVVFEEMKAPAKHVMDDSTIVEKSVVERETMEAPVEKANIDSIDSTTNQEQDTSVASEEPVINQSVDTVKKTGLVKRIWRKIVPRKQ